MQCTKEQDTEGRVLPPLLERGPGDHRDTKGPRTTWREDGRWPKVFERSQELWKVMGITWPIKRPAERNKTGASSGWVMWAAASCAATHIFPGHRGKARGEGAVIPQAGASYCSRIKGKMLKKLNKDLEARRSQAATDIHACVSRSPF